MMKPDYGVGTRNSVEIFTAEAHPGCVDASAHQEAQVEQYD